MSGLVTKSLPVTGNSLNCELRKKPNRKRHRNKSRNINLKKKRLKKFHSKKKGAPCKLNTLKFDYLSASNQVMSNWYWSNYRKAVEWQEKHRIAYWKSCALALFEENRHLLQIINQLHPGVHPKLSVTQNLLNKECSSDERQNLNQCNNYDVDNNVEIVNNDDDDDDNDYEESNDIEFEMSEEMMEFFEKSYKHKMELKEHKEKELVRNAEDEIQHMQTNKLKRSTEMNLLYGDGASMIIGMETAVQLSFEKYCDTKSPKYWPNIPFRL